MSRERISYLKDLHVEKNPFDVGILANVQMVLKASGRTFVPVVWEEFVDGYGAVGAVSGAVSEQDDWETVGESDLDSPVMVEMP